MLSEWGIRNIGGIGMGSEVKNGTGLNTHPNQLRYTSLIPHLE